MIMLVKSIHLSISQAQCGLQPDGVHGRIFAMRFAVMIPWKFAPLSRLLLNYCKVDSLGSVTETT
jgi:hypothetical protein